MQKIVIQQERLLSVHAMTTEGSVATLTIRNIDAPLKERLRIRAARNGRSMEAELRQIVREALSSDRKPEPNIAEAIRRRFLPFGGVDELEPHPPVPVREPTSFDR